MATAETTANATWISPPPRPELSAEQKQLVLAGTAELMRATVLGRSPTIADPTLAGAANVPVSGVFVSLKRNKHLRSCCGMLTSTVPLGVALQDATVRTAREDTRFPTVSPSELDHLDMEVWLLFAPEPVPAMGEERANHVTVGRHGLQIVRGQARGLLLPGVPVENEWGTEEFLQQVCIKAGLPPTSWKEDGTELYTFEGEALRGRVTDGEAAEAPRRTAPFLPEEVEAYADFCRGNIAAVLTGATPSYYFMGAPDGNVAGVVINVTHANQNEGQTLSQVSLRPGVPLQSTLFTLAQAAAQGLVRLGIQANELGTIRVGLALLYDPAMHGTVADADLAGLEPRQRAVLVIERNKSGLVYDHRRSAQELLAEAASEAQVSRPAGAAVFSLAALSTLDRITFSSAPRPMRGPAAREPGVAGMFYPADPAELTRMVDDMLGDAKDKPKAWLAAMVPHAGLIYSGRIAAQVLKRIKLPSTIICIGPKHTGLGVEWSVAPQQTWNMPGFTLESDPKLARQLTQAISGLELDAAAHQREHAIEVELPFIARLAPETRVVGIAMSGGDLEACQRFATGLASVIREMEERPLLLVSSDMNHFATDAENRRLDEMALKALDTLDPKTVFETVTENRISMCGVLPAVVVLETLRQLDVLKKAERAGYATTADTTGDTSRVVGYAGMLFG